MANLQDKTPENVPGRYYVDNTCIDCDMCREIAPQIFKRHDDGAYSYVYRQPVTEEQMQNCVRFAVISPQRNCEIELLSLKCFKAVRNVVLQAVELLHFREEQALAITSKEEISSSQEAASTRRPRLRRLRFAGPRRGAKDASA